MQSEEINLLENSLNIRLLNENKNRKESEYLAVRKFSSYKIEEYEEIKKKVKQDSKTFDIIYSFLSKKSKDFNKIDINKAVGPLLPLSFLIENAYKYKGEYTNFMNQKYMRLKNYVCNYRTIFGDGNCYYRAVMFRYIELLIFNKKIDYLKFLIIDIYKSFEKEEVTKRSLFPEINPLLFTKMMIIILEELEKNDIIKAHQAFYILLSSKFFDLSLVLYLRFILYDYIKNNEKKLYLEKFPVLIGNLLPSIYEKEGVFDFNSFYTNYLLKMFIPAEKIIIYLTPFVLGINLDVVLFDDNED